ncbi:hypothetical protein [Pseudoflavonifractor phocaeensis]|uniref:hypothetical protein n=1 Tax=Pseudoflavonifractor phocaeensis TaxID=1870988 RepID=UPI001959E4B9|nr:hypothetical protein [Pseudoflavonifractor phocaeensis]MBM6886968.1 hypothetical protein [Pseudoflavonifractor phocaeensis]
MKKIAVFASTSLFLYLISGCSSSTPSSTPSVEPSNTPEAVVQEPLTDAEVKMMYSAPDEYKGALVELSGVVFNTVEYDEDGVYFQMWGDPENSDLNTIVTYPDPNFALESDQYVKITGTVMGEFTGTNAFGGEISAAVVTADTLEISTYQDVVSPTLATASADVPTVEQLGYSITVQKAELAENETRLYISATNNGSANFIIYSFNMTIVQDGHQYEEESNYDADYPELQSDIRPSVTTEGIVTFPALENAPFQLIIEARSDDWDEDIQDYVFNLDFQ